MTNSITKEVKEILGNDFTKNQSPSLRLSKYINFDKNRDDNKRNQIDAVVKCHNNASSRPSFEIRHAEQLYMKLGGRLIINQAGGVLENAGLCLDRNYGNPFIPGSAVKGCARHYAWEQWYAMEEGPERQENAKKIANTFGFPTNDQDLDTYLADLGLEEPQAGKISFFPAHPYGKASLETDILTCHHPKYYKGDLPKALDNEDPIPLPFPVVKAGSTFLFQLVPLKPDADIEWTKKILQNALEINGIGAKTAAGYGWFEEDLSIKARKEAEQQKQLEELNAQQALEDERQHQAELKAQQEAEKAAEQAAKEAEINAKKDAAKNSNLEQELTKFGSFKDCINLMDNGKRAEKVYSDQEKASFVDFIKTNYTNANKKESKKFKNAKKDYWKRIGEWFGHELKNQWFKEIVG